MTRKGSPDQESNSQDARSGVKPMLEKLIRAVVEASVFF